MARALWLLLYDMLLVCLALEDWKFRKIKNQYVKGILILSAAAIFSVSEIGVGSRVLGMFVVSVPMAVIALVKNGSFGGGDIKLTFACGAFLGAELLVKGTVTALFLAGMYSVWLICTEKGRKNGQFALGPFLSAGYILATIGLY